MAIDGRYKDFDYPSDLSDDGTREVINTFFNCYLIDAGGLTEVEKRQIYFDKFNPVTYKFLLPVDADEYFYGDWQDFICELNDLYDKYQNKENKPVIILIQTFSPNNDSYQPRPRIFLNAHNVKTGPRHNEFRSKIDNSLLYAIDEVKAMKLKHDYKLRYPSYEERRIAYQKKLCEHDAQV